VFRAPPPERRRRGDLVAAAVLVAGLAVAGTAVAVTSDVAGTTHRPAAAPVTAPPAALAAPAAFAEVWRAPSGGTTGPVLAGPAVVTADDGVVTGRDAATGAEAWSYTRDRPLCAVGSGFPNSGGGEEGRALAVHANGPLDAPGTWCNDLTMLSGATGERVGSRNPDARPGTRLVADDTYVLATGADHLEAWRYDLVRTVEYGTVPAQEQTGRQPRPECRYGSAALGGRHLGVVERCPDEAVDRLTVLVTDGEDGSESPQVTYSVPLTGSGAAVVAVTADRAAVALPGRLAVHDGAGAQIAVTEVEHAGGDPPGGVVTTTGDDRFRFWFTGSSVVALDAGELSPVWTFPGALGPAVRYGADLLVPVPGGLQVLDDRGEPRRLLPVQRADPTAPVVPAVLGEVVLEQRGGEVVALRPA
jgi:hypothetical protein